MNRDAKETAQRAWRALLTGVRAVNLYSVDHSQVSRAVASLGARLSEALPHVEQLDFTLDRDGVHSGGELVHSSAEDRETLIERLYADGVRTLRFHGVPDAESIHRLFIVMAAYCHAERAPLRSAAKTLH